MSLHDDNCLCRLLDDMLLPDMPIAFNTEDWPARDEDVQGGPYFGYCNVPKLYTNLPFPDLATADPLSCGEGCTPFTETDHRKEQAVFLGRPTGEDKQHFHMNVQIACGQHVHKSHMHCMQAPDCKSHRTSIGWQLKQQCLGDWFIVFHLHP